MKNEFYTKLLAAIKSNVLYPLNDQITSVSFKLKGEISSLKDIIGEAIVFVAIFQFNPESASRAAALWRSRRY